MDNEDIAHAIEKGKEVKTSLETLAKSIKDVNGLEDLHCEIVDLVEGLEYNIGELQIDLDEKEGREPK
jgi:hypothetical protein